MEIKVLPEKQALGQCAAEKAAAILKHLLTEKDKVRIVVATGGSQEEFIQSLAAIPDIAWDRTELFHLDEYVGMSITHPASFRRWLQERVVDHVAPGAFHFVNGDAEDLEAECRRIGELLTADSIDIAFVGIGENGHLAFNDPPADFETQDPYIVVDLDEKCRRQQVGEGCFKTLEDVPTQAISMSVSAIMSIDHIICCVPDRRKAEAVRDCLAADAEVTNKHPSSVLKKHSQTYVYLDQESASLLGDATI